MAGADTIRASEKESGDVIDKTPPTFTLDDLYAELRGEESTDGITAREWLEEKGIPQTDANVRRVRRWMSDLHAKGEFELIGPKRFWSQLKGRYITADAYRPVSRGGDE